MNFPAADILVLAIFVICLATMAAGALIAVLTTRLIRSVCGLAICCFGLAGLFYFLRSPFLALMEILIYVGAVCVTIVFAVMLAEPDEPAAKRDRSSWVWGGTAIAVAGGLFWALWRLGTGVKWAAPTSHANSGSLNDIGVALLSRYSMAFELISLALLVAIIGALVIARKGRSKA